MHAAGVLFFVVRHDLPALLHLVDSGQVGVSDKTGLATAVSLRKIEAVLMGRCTDAGLVRLLTSDPATRDHCLQAGAKLLVVPEKAEKILREGLRKLGYIFPAG
jgi:hypothetical protein